ncbi:MAG TPA: AtpZ/AtpI family protein [Mycobacteriales bacterium]|nr:AtpZ/AtpI family protein [Mycobacteriales bacterium]
MPEQRPERPATRPAPGLSDLLSIGAICGVMIGLGVFLGYLVDRAAGTAPLLTFVGLAFGILGAATGSYFVIRPFTSQTPGSDTGSTPKD